MKVIWTRHAIERQQEWERKLGITRQEIEQLVVNPAQIIQGDLGVLVAQALWRQGLLRAPFVQVGADRRIVTVYWTSRIEKYWKGG